LKEGEFKLGSEAEVLYEGAVGVGIGAGIGSGF